MIAAIAAANDAQHATSYGDDALTQALHAAFCEVFETPVEVFLTTTGTAANALSISALTPPWGAVLCHREAHIETDECGAPEFFSNGAKLVLIDGPCARVTPDGLHAALRRHQRGVHSVRASVLSLTNATERGTTYSPEQTAALADIAHSGGLSVHLDGARFANALVHQGCTPAELTHRAGVDVLSFGATKNGALNAEAIIVFNSERVGDIARLRKRSGHLVSKHRYLAAQLLAYLNDDLWLTLAARANANAARIAAAAGDWCSHACESNSVFLKPGAAVLDALRAGGVQFYDWGDGEAPEARLVASWCQAETDLAQLENLLYALRAERG